jgi:hypothetical protein
VFVLSVSYCDQFHVHCKSCTCEMGINVCMYVCMYCGANEIHVVVFSISISHAGGTRFKLRSQEWLS